MTTTIPSSAVRLHHDSMRCVGMRQMFEGQLHVEANGDGYVIAPESVVAGLGGWPSADSHRRQCPGP